MRVHGSKHGDMHGREDGKWCTACMAMVQWMVDDV